MTSAMPPCSHATKRPAITGQTIIVDGGQILPESLGLSLPDRCQPAGSVPAFAWR